MSDLLIQGFETRPISVDAVNWDGSKKNAKQIIKWLHGRHDILAEFNNSAGYDDSSEFTDKISLTVYSNGSVGRMPVEPGSWIVVTETSTQYPGAYAEVYDAATFADKFRVGQHTR